MRHADWLAERILFLDGLPNFQLLGRLRIGETVEEVLKGDLAIEVEAVAQLKEAIAYCEEVRDYVSRDLFQRILASEEEHVDTLERQFEMIARMGIQNYIQLNAWRRMTRPSRARRRTSGLRITGAGPRGSAYMSDFTPRPFSLSAVEGHE